MYLNAHTFHNVIQHCFLILSPWNYSYIDTQIANVHGKILCTILIPIPIKHYNISLIIFLKDRYHRLGEAYSKIAISPKTIHLFLKPHTHIAIPNHAERILDISLIDMRHWNIHV